MPARTSGNPFPALLTSVLLAATLLLTLAVPSAHALTCTWNATGCGTDTRVLGVQNSTGGFLTNSQSQLPSVETYTGSICCSAPDNITLTTTCGTPFLRLSNESNAHVQQTNYTTYPYEACLSAPVGIFTCEYADDTCPGTSTCIASMQGRSGNNWTNAHIGECSVYQRKVCCSFNAPPTHDEPWLNATDEPLNRTNADLVATNRSTNDTNGDAVRNIYSFAVDDEPIALLLAPFETDTGASASTTVRDYARSNNGTLENSPAWTGSGVAGGAYSLDGTDDYVSFPDTAPDNTTLDFTGQPLTIMLWIRPDPTETNGTVLAKPWSEEYFDNDTNETLPPEQNYAFTFRDDNTTQFTLGGNESVAMPAITTTPGSWTHLAAVIDGERVVLYRNGTLASNTSHGIVNWTPNRNDTNASLVLGAPYPWPAWSGNASEAFRGLVDDLRIYNRSLSQNQIAAIIAEASGDTSNATIVAAETTKGETWWADVTPNDGVQDGETKRTNNVTIENSPPNAVELLLPGNNTTILERYPLFTWNVTDNDSDVVTSTWTLTSPAGCAAVPPVDTNQTEYASVDRLCVDDWYNWTVSACDEDGACIENATPFTFLINSSVGVTLVNPTVEFGVMQPSTPGFNSTNSTLSDDPLPLRYNNTGNVDISVWTRASAALWTAQPLNTTYFQYADQGSSAWEPFDSAYDQVVALLTVGTLRDLEVNVTVPQGEPATTKNTSVLVMGVLAE